MLDESDISDDRRQEVMNALVVEEIAIQDIMVAREEIAALSTDNSPEENLAIIQEYPHLRFPLVDEELEDFRGIVYLATLTNHFKAFKNGEVSLEDLATSPMMLPAEEEVSDAVDRFQDEQHELALVEDNGDVVGLLTATDAFEEVMGELEDPIDEQSSREQPPGANLSGV